MKIIKKFNGRRKKTKLRIKIRISLHSTSFTSCVSFADWNQKQPTRGVLGKRCSENMQQIYQRTPMSKCDFNKVDLQLYWNQTSTTWGFSCKFTVYLQNTVLYEYLWRAACVKPNYALKIQRFI